MARVNYVAPSGGEPHSDVFHAPAETDPQAGYELTKRFELRTRSARMSRCGQD